MALVLDKPLMRAINIDATTPLRITIYGNEIRITAAANGIPDDELDAHADALRKTYTTMLENLAR
jgi:hypothetical protein